jgi:uncharacterized protein (DUF486 family)
MTDDFEQSQARQLEQDRAAAAEHRLLIIALLINSALYLTGAFIAGLMLGNRIAWLCALTSAGLCYIGPMFQLAAPAQRTYALVIVVLSIVFGVAAGVALLVGG